ncbi:hypothetical protein IEQ34_006410 [Dendrobium chrysotoxum]|uniref:Uncharacterized protein n=1 Tax=Dendrobium chrysotoxum TaxID=161865 RepID=A0AAV7HEQ0_DENCH|nr:hypothetical protein IEQ34_006410 [Dendrobium chrysotoxum]
MTAIPASSNSRASMNWSAPSGHVSKATPATTASITEFHPQCVKNHPTAAWPRISTCGTHPFTTNPRSATLSSNPAGISVPSLTHQRNRNPLSSRAAEIAAACSGGGTAWLPKQT